jgi:hypothetical protein
VDEHGRVLLDELRAWVRGSYTLEAGVELLLRAFNGRFARPGLPWIKTDDRSSWVDFAAIPHHLRGLSGGERRFLLLLASLTVGERIDLAGCLGGLDRSTFDLVLAAVAHVAGLHEQSEFVPERTADGDALITP